MAYYVSQCWDLTKEANGTANTAGRPTLQLGKKKSHVPQTTASKIIPGSTQQFGKTQPPQLFQASILVEISTQNTKKNK